MKIFVDIGNIIRKYVPEICFWGSIPILLASNLKRKYLAELLGFSDQQYSFLSIGVSFGLLCVKYLNWKIKKNFKDISDQFDDEKSDEQAHLIHGILSSFGVEKDVPTRGGKPPTAYQARKELLSLVMRYLHQAPTKTSQIIDSADGSTSLISKYYAYTLAAAHRTAELTTMSLYLSAIISKIIREKHYGKVIDNVCHLPALIVPQDRNVLLAESVTNAISIYRDIHIPILTYQPEPRNGVDIGLDPNPYELFYRIFLGCDSLRDKLRRCAAYYPKCKEFVIHCILVDDNVTRAKAMVRMIKDGSNERGDERKWDRRLTGDFDKIANKGDVISELAKGTVPSGRTIRFAPVNDCATLFVASDEALFTTTEDSLPKLFKDQGLLLWCYFALPEEVKNALWNIKTTSGNKELDDEQIADLLKVNSSAFDKLPQVVCDGWTTGWIDCEAETLDNLIKCFDFSDKTGNTGGDSV